MNKYKVPDKSSRQNFEIKLDIPDASAYTRAMVSVSICRNLGKLIEKSMVVSTLNLSILLLFVSH